MTISSIGTASRNYSTITAWHAAFPGGVGTWEGECYNDSTFNEALTIGGTLGCPEILRCAAGQSAFDNSANPLKYDTAKGVAITDSSNYSKTFTLNSNITMQGLQIRQAGAGNSNACLGLSVQTHVNVERCLLWLDLAVSGGSGCLVLNIFGGVNAVDIANPTFRNCVMIANVTSVASIYATNFINCTMVAPSDLANTNNAIGVGDHSLFENLAIFGFSGGAIVDSGSAHDNVANNIATDQATVGITASASLTSQTFSSQFNGVTSSAPDFKLKTGASMIDAGISELTFLPAAIDIFGTARPQGAAWDIGAHEFVAVVHALPPGGGLMPYIARR